MITDYMVLFYLAFAKFAFDVFYTMIEFFPVIQEIRAFIRVFYPNFWREARWLDIISFISMWVGIVSMIPGTILDLVFWILPMYVWYLT